MVKVITYGTFDMLHFGHINLLKRAKALGDYLIVGVTTENFDISRGKLNVKQSLMDRMMAVKETGIADEVIAEEYEGQKIDDIRKYGVDIFAIGSDWRGKFDYLNEFCQVIYLERTKGISSTQLRNNQNFVNLGIAGYTPIVDRFVAESHFVSGMNIKGLYTSNPQEISEDLRDEIDIVTDSYQTLLESVDAVYVFVGPNERYDYVKKALENGKNVLCEAPISLREERTKKLFSLAKENNLVLYDALKTAYFLAFNRLTVLLKSGIIGEVKALDVTCSSLATSNYWSLQRKYLGGSLTSWGPYALFAIFKILGMDYESYHFTSAYKEANGVDLFTKIDFKFPHSVASAKLGLGVKSEGDLVISGTKGYIYVPSPWWKTDYFEVRYENFTNNRRYFYQLEGDGLRYEQAAFIKAIRDSKTNLCIEQDISIEISKVLDSFFNGDESLKSYI